MYFYIIRSKVFPLAEFAKETLCLDGNISVIFMFFIVDSLVVIFVAAGSLAFSISISSVIDFGVSVGFLPSLVYGFLAVQLFGKLEPAL